MDNLKVKKYLPADPGGLPVLSYLLIQYIFAPGTDKQKNHPHEVRIEQAVNTPLPVPHSSVSGPD